MPYQIIIEFPDKEIADRFCGQMSDGFGEEFCDFSSWKQLDGTDGTKSEHYVKHIEDNRSVFYVNSLGE